MSISTKLDRIATLAKQMPEKAMTSLSHHIDLEWLREAYARTRKDGAPGMDGKTAAEYGANLEENLQSLLDRAKSGRYFAPPVRRVHIPKGNGKQTRPIGIPTFEDKVLQRAVTMALEAVYEQDFLNCSYGFRPGRSAHQALAVLQRELMEMRGGWIVEVDIARFFDTLDHAHLRQMLNQRVRDGVILRLIGKWLNAGVLESGKLSRPDAGTPQGGVISPLLANVYLHEVLDKWFTYEVKPGLDGLSRLVRYADDFVVVFSREESAREFMTMLAERFAKYGLTLHPEKTRLVKFRRPPRKPLMKSDGTEDPGTFDLLGFTHYWARTLKGGWAVLRKTARDRFSRALKNCAEWCKRHRHDSVKSQWATLVRKLKGHYEYFGLIGNSQALTRFRYHVQSAWIKWLGRRSSKPMYWWRARLLLERYPLPPAQLPQRRSA